MDTDELQKRGFYIDSGFLVTPSGRVELSSYTGAQAIDKTMHFLLKVLIFIVLLNISTLLVMGGATMPAGFGLLYLSGCWFGASQYEVVGMTPHGSHTLAEIKPAFYKLPSNEKEVADAIVTLILEHSRQPRNA